MITNMVHAFTKRYLPLLLAAAAVAGWCDEPKKEKTEEKAMSDKVVKTDEEWRKQLTPEQYEVARKKGTERAFTGKYYKMDEQGVYHCVACDNLLFTSETKFDSGCGWPSYFKPVSEHAVKHVEDNSHGMRRTEVVCAKCGAHLGHVFPDAPQTPTGQRYCINSVILKFEKKGDAKEARGKDPEKKADRK